MGGKEKEKERQNKRERKRKKLVEDVDKKRRKFG